jgi:hypothetical protein
MRGQLAVLVRFTLRRKLACVREPEKTFGNGVENRAFRLADRFQHKLQTDKSQFFSASPSRKLMCHLTKAPHKLARGVRF